MDHNHFVAASSLFGFDLGDFWRSFLLFVASYLGTKHGSTNGNGSSGH